jgi:hypothetical protein
MSKTEQTIIVTGDVSMDWNLARTRRSKSDVSFWSSDDTTVPPGSAVAPPSLIVYSQMI